MPWFEYEGMTPGGTAIAGRLEADNREQANEDLEEMQIRVTVLREAVAPPKAAKALTEDDLVFFNHQLASLAEAGIALDDGLAQLARDVESARLKRWIEDIVRDLRRGIPIDRAIEVRERGLPILYSRVIRAGIESGELPATLLNLNQHLRLTGATRRMAWELASYPLLVGILGFGVVSAFFLLVPRHFAEIFEDWNTTLPLVTEWLIEFSRIYPIVLAVTCVVVIGLVLLWWQLRLSERGMALREWIVSSTPVIGRVYRASLIARFLRSISTQVASGIPLPQAMRLGADATGSQSLIEDAERLAAEVEQGQSIFVANQSSKVIPPLFGFCVQVAAGRENLPVAVAQLAHAYENRATHSQTLLRSLLLPLLVIAVGCFLLFAIVGMFLPLITLINSVSG